MLHQSPQSQTRAKLSIAKQPEAGGSDGVQISSGAALGPIPIQPGVLQDGAQGDLVELLTPWHGVIMSLDAIQSDANFVVERDGRNEYTGLRSAVGDGDHEFFARCISCDLRHDDEYVVVEFFGRYVRITMREARRIFGTRLRGCRSSEGPGKMAFSERDGVVVLFGNTSIAAKINDRAWGVEDPVEYERRSCPNVASYPIIGTVAPAMAITASMCRKETGTVDLFGDDFIQAATRFAEEGDLGVVAFGVFALQDLASSDWLWIRYGGHDR